MDEAQQAELMALYLDEGESILTQLGAAWVALSASGDEETVRQGAVRLAHGFAGISGSTGFLNAMALAQALDAMARTKLSARQLELAQQATALLRESLGKHTFDAEQQRLTAELGAGSS